MNDSPPSAGNRGRRVVITGATGLVGSHILQGLLEDESVVAVHALGRRPSPVSHPKLSSQVVDFTALPTLPPVDEAYLALGTTIKAAGSREAFWSVDFEASLAVARVALTAGARRIALVSAMGADAHSPFFYNRVKGQLEDTLTLLGFDALVIARPSLLTGDRTALDQPVRIAEHLALHLGRLLKPLLPARLRPIAASAVAAALLRRTPVARGKEILTSGAMQRVQKPA
jgi:uncharacterized protein YbjT (DUF2867 family)